MSETLLDEIDPLDVPHDRFLTGGQAWQLCRTGQVDPEDFGIFDMHSRWADRKGLSPSWNICYTKLTAQALS